MAKKSKTSGQLATSVSSGMQNVTEDTCQQTQTFLVGISYNCLAHPLIKAHITHALPRPNSLS